MTEQRIVILEDREVLHPAAFNQGPRVTRVQRISIDGDVFECKFWTECGRIHYVESIPL